MAIPEHIVSARGKAPRRPEPRDVAHQLGTVRELVSRNPMRLHAEGLIQVDARNITVLDLPN
jgi:hypothetical protein